MVTRVIQCLKLGTESPNKEKCYTTSLGHQHRFLPGIPELWPLQVFPLRYLKSDCLRNEKIKPSKCAWHFVFKFGVIRLHD